MSYSFGENKYREGYIWVIYFAFFISQESHIVRTPPLTTVPLINDFLRKMAKFLHKKNTY